MDSVPDNPRGLGCPIRIPPDQSLLAAPRGFSQRATSFIASRRQGIHQMPFSHSTPPQRQDRPHPTRSRDRAGAPPRAAQRPGRRRRPRHPDEATIIHGRSGLFHPQPASVKPHPRDAKKASSEQGAFAYPCQSPASARPMRPERGRTRHVSARRTMRPRPHRPEARRRASPSPPYDVHRSSVFPYPGTPAPPCRPHLAVPNPQACRPARAALDRPRPTPGPPNWWARADLNGRPHAYQACALTS